MDFQDRKSETLSNIDNELHVKPLQQQCLVHAIVTEKYPKEKNEEENKIPQLLIFTILK